MDTKQEKDCYNLEYGCKLHFLVRESRLSMDSQFHLMKPCYSVHFKEKLRQGQFTPPKLASVHVQKLLLASEVKQHNCSSQFLWRGSTV